MTRDGQLVVVDALYSNARIHIIEQRGKIDTYPFHPLSSRYDDSKCRFLAVHGEEVLTSDLGKWQLSGLSFIAFGDDGAVKFLF